MSKKLAGWLLLAVVTFLNLRLFLSRWAEEPRSAFGLIISDTELASIAIGFGALIAALALLDILRSLRFFAFFALPAVCAAVVLAMPSLGVFKNLEYPIINFMVVGAIVALTFTQLKDSAPEQGETKLWRSFVLMTLASLNAFFLMAPWTTHVPSYVQDTISEVPMMSGFYYGSVHSDISPVSIGLRWIINQFFSRPSINATALSSMLYVAVALAMAGISLEMVFGRLWGWALLVLAWTDRWLFASAISSAIIGQPVLSTASVLLLCTWSLWRKPVPLSWREAAFLGAANAAGLLYNFYGYSAARMTWLVGSGIAALILIFRRAVWFNFDGFRKVAVALLPSAAIVFLIWAVIFQMDSPRFAGQLFISPKAEFQINDVNSYRVKVISVHDPDVPIWWGTGRPTDGTNVSLYWKRTPQELFEKIKWFMDQVSSEPPISFVLVLLGGLGMALCLTSPIPLRRWFGFFLMTLTLVSFSTFVLAQDHSAYRRALATNLLIVVGVVSVFAVKCRSRFFKWIALAVCGALSLLKAPTELNALFHEGFWSPVCVNCQPIINVRDFVNDPAFVPVTNRPLRFYIRGGSLPPLYTRCASITFESNEFKELSPNSSEITVQPGQLAQSFSALPKGEILVVSCFPSSLNDPELAGVCSGTPPFGKPLAMVPADRKDRVKVWWALVEKE